MSAFRRRVEHVLPWFDAAEYRREATRQAEVIASARVEEQRSKRTLEAYHHAHRIRTRP